MVDFSNRSERYEWLKKQSHEVCIVMAVRSALRVFPFAIIDAGKPSSQEFDLTEYAKRAILISSVAPVSPTDEIRSAALAAAALDAAALDATITAADAALAAALAAGDAALAAADATITAADAAASALAASSSADAAAFEAGHTVLELLAMPLWPQANPLEDNWQQARQTLASSAVDQSFWISWYERFLQGKPQNWEMLEEIALTLTPEDWESDSAHVNSMIAKIQDKYLLATTPLAEKVELNAATGRLHIVPEPMSQKALYQNALEKVRDDMAYFRDGGFSNAHAALEKVFTKTLDRTFENYTSSPQRVHDDFVLARNRILRLIESGELADDDDIRDFIQVLETGALDIRGSVKKVAEAVDKREANRWRELNEMQQGVIDAGVEETAKASDPEMAAEMREDGADALDKSLVDSDGNLDPIAVDARRRISSRLPRALRALKKTARGVGDGHSIGEMSLAVTELFRLFGL